MHLGVWLGDGHSAGARYTSADPEIALYLEAEGMCVTRQSQRYLYFLQLPDAKRYPVDRTCAVCGKTFTPKNLEVTTCGRQCGGRLGRPGTQRLRSACERCGAHITGLLPGYVMCRSCIDRFGSFTGALRELGVLSNKHIPGLSSRLGGAAPGAASWPAGHRRHREPGRIGPVRGHLQAACRRLPRIGHEPGLSVRSVGKASTRPLRRVVGRHVITFTTEDDVFRLERKRLTHKERRQAKTTPRTRLRYIAAVRAVPSVPVRCVQVESAAASVPG